jgi:tRNA (cytidine56-2'-O)-methyltransferase
MITVLRLGHRPARDKRITTHIGLVARAFSAGCLLVDTKDENLESTILNVIKRFGGPFKIETGVAWRKLVRNWPGKIVHLTMYGEHIDSVLNKIPKNADLLIIVGSEKVPREIFECADYNIAIGNQPHSEVAALAIFLDRFFKGDELKKRFNGKLRIVGSSRGKIVIETDDDNREK